MESKSGNIITNFQGVRGYAILYIFISHCDFGLNVAGINRTTWFGAFGVSIFIILSGYLLMANHYDSDIKFDSYVKRKIAKFYPLHILTLLASLPFAVKSLVNLDIKAWGGLFFNITLLQSWIPSSSIYFSYNAVSWYLSVVVFYIVISPLVLKIWIKRNSRAEILSVLLLGVIIDIVWCMIFSSLEVAHWIIYIFPLIRMIEYILGGGIWKLLQYVDSNKKANIMGVLGVIISAVFLVISTNVNSEWFSIVVWIVPSILLLIFAGCNTRLSQVIFSNRIIKALGDISFEFFMIHQLCIRYVTAILNKINVHCIILNVFFCFIITCVSVLIYRKIVQKIETD